MKSFAYFEPSTMQECANILAQHGAKPIAGGTDVVPRLKNGTLAVEAVVALRKVADLFGVSMTKDGLFLGAMTNLRDLSQTQFKNKAWQVIAEGAGHVSSMQVRNMATIGGNTCNASPSADTVPGLLALDAQAVIFSQAGERTMPLDAFFKGPGMVALEKGELLKGFLVPAWGEDTTCAYEKFAIRGDTDITIVGAAARLSVSGSTIADAKVVLGGVAPTPLVVLGIEKILIGQALDEATLDRAAACACSSCRPITDQRATKEYRKDMVAVFVKKAIRRAYAQLATCESVCPA